MGTAESEQLKTMASIISKKTIFEIELMLIQMNLVIGIGLMLYGTYIYMIASHNIDLVLNAQLMVNDVNVLFHEENVSKIIDFRNVTDLTAGFKSVKLLHSYIRSGNLQILALVVIIIGTFFVGMSIEMLMNRARRPRLCREYPYTKEDFEEDCLGKNR